MDAGANYTVQLTRPRDGWACLQALTSAARSASEEMQREGIPVHFLRSVFVPEEDTCFFLYRAPSAERVQEAIGRASLDAAHPAKAISESEDGTR